MADSGAAVIVSVGGRLDDDRTAVAEASDPVLNDVVGFVAVVVEDEFVDEVVEEDVDEVTGFELEPDLSSGQTPVVQGSLEQHPRKLPLVQTYHCLLPVQLIGLWGFA